MTYSCADVLKIILDNEKRPIHSPKLPSDFSLDCFNYYAYGIPNPIITDDPNYLKLGPTKKSRQAKYRKMVKELVSYFMNNETLLNWPIQCIVNMPSMLISRHQEIFQ